MELQNFRSKFSVKDLISHLATVYGDNSCLLSVMLIVSFIKANLAGFLSTELQECCLQEMQAQTKKRAQKCQRRAVQSGVSEVWNNTSLSWLLGEQQTGSC